MLLGNSQIFRTNWNKGTEIESFLVRIYPGECTSHFCQTEKFAEFAKLKICRTHLCSLTHQPSAGF